MLENQRWLSLFQDGDVPRGINTAKYLEITMAKMAFLGDESKVDPRYACENLIETSQMFGRNGYVDSQGSKERGSI